MKLNYGDAGAIKVSERYAAPVASLTELKGIPADRRVDGMQVLVMADGSRWRFLAAGALTGDDILIVTPTAGTGTWLRMPGGALLLCPFTYATADATAIITVPTGCRLHILEPFWKVTTSFTGGSSSAIGLSSNKSALTTKGDLLGGAAGDVLATLAAATTLIPGTVGVKYDTLAERRIVWEAGDTVRLDRINSAFTAGVGAAALSANVLANDGA